MLLAAMSLLQAHTPEFVPDGIISTDVFVKKSTVCDGLGLFAAEPLPAHSIVSLYPIHGIGIDDSATGRVEMIASAEDMDYFSALDVHEYRVYLRHHDHRNLCIDINPTRPTATSWSAHRVNDACMCSSRAPADIDHYLEESTSRATCALMPIGRAPLTAVVTTRGVDAGEELFASYGPSYWVGGQPVVEGEREAPQRRMRSSDVLDGEYWAERGGPRTRALLEAASEIVHEAEEALLRGEPADAVSALDAGLEEAIETVREMLAKR